LLGVFQAMRGGLDRFLDTGPLNPSFRVFLREMRRLEAGMADGADLDAAVVHAAFRRAREHFLTQDGEPRKLLQAKYKKAVFASLTDWQVHRDLVITHARAVVAAYGAYRHDLNVLVSRGVWRMFRIAEVEYRRTLDARALLDFPDILLKALELLRQMEEFAQSRFRLEARYHHVLVDEFQDTSRAQWELISLLVRAWGEGAGLAYTGALAPSIFIVGDRKQSIYGFRDADVSLFRDARRFLDALRPGGDVRRSISRSFRAVPPLLAFVNDLCDAVDKAPARRDAFVYEEQDRFPLDGQAGDPSDTLAVVVGDTLESCARATAAEIDRLIAGSALVRDRDTGVRRPIRSGDVAILFRTRESHREYERALEEHGISAYVYKGLGFFDADEIQDVLAVLWYLADPVSDLRAAAWLRSRFVRMSDEGLRRLGPRLAASLDSTDPPSTPLGSDDAEALAAARQASLRWRGLVDRMPPAELLDRVLEESAYAAELRGHRLLQARENLKKIRAIIRRIQNRGYGTVARIIAHLDHLAVGDEANAVIDATDAVSLMTVHAAKGLEYPVVFVVNLARGTGNWRDAIRVGGNEGQDEVSVSVGDFESPADEDEPARDREETKRLLYVALTRARDRLYLGSLVKDGRFQPGRGSLGDVLPQPLRDVFADAASGATTVSWRGSSRPHVIRVCRDGDAAPSVEARARASAPRPDSDFAALHDDAIPRLTSSSAGGREDRPAPARHDDHGSTRSVGILVHRLLQRVTPGAEVGDDHLREHARAILSTLPALEIDVPAVLIELATARFRTLSARPDLRELYQSGRARHEVPFTMLREGAIVRGTIDCLIAADDRVTVLEFKTGVPRAEHQAQAEVYRAAAQALFPGAAVEARLVYASATAVP
jgi:ATP-dependent helicase/nuclease subunit A